MNLRRDQRGYSYVLFLWILAAGVIIASGLTFFRIYKNSSLAGHGTSHCSVQSGVQLCIAGVPDKILPTDTRELSLTLTNQNQKSYLWSGSSSCGAEPYLSVNGRADIRTCTTDVTRFQLKPHEAWKATFELNGAGLNPGDNSLQVRWAGLSSDKLTVQRAVK
ncbi:MAG TPA: hypothetical protein VN554_02560 [Verrucomicrobiae bacterium]|nr:hypothetical protein [Verrucomicrobiae bacterium]